ncbi:unnamed protein product [Tenebrio molitor]|nr:unnamed protein product [Tenebrio molitor]
MAFNFRGLLGLLSLITLAASDDLPTLYEYYTEGGIKSGLSVDQPYFTLNGKNISIYSGAMHYFRIPPELWQDRLRKLRATGANTVETYIAWNIHEPQDGVFDFGDGGTESGGWADVARYITLAQEEDLFVILRPGPFINAEWEFGGFPSWLLRNEGIVVRTSDSTFMSYVERYFAQLMPILAELQFTKGGPIIMFQVENEFGFSSKIDMDYLQELYDLYKSSDLVELLVSNDGPDVGQSGTLPGKLFQTVDFGADAKNNFDKLIKIQPDKPVMDMEFYTGWLDHWTEQHHTKSLEDFTNIYEDILAYPGSANLYPFHGGTSWRFLGGSNNGNGDNSGFNPVTSCYDFDAVLNEAGDYTPKYNVTRDLIKKYNTIEVATPDPPEVKERKVYDSLDLNGQLKFEDILKQVPDKIDSDVPLSMEMLPINQNSGQSYGYIVYHKEGLDISADSLLTITGHVRDTVMVLVNNVLISKPLTSSDVLEEFGYWKIENGNITLTTEDLEDATLDLVFENWGRVGFGNFYYQFKGLTDDNQVFLNDEELNSWTIYPLEFKKAWNQNLTDWGEVEESPSGPALYKATLTIDDEDDITDTFIDMRDWVKGFAMVNGMVLGRYASRLGPQQTYYVPGPWLQKGDNEIIVFEHSLTPASQIKFTKDVIFDTP